MGLEGNVSISLLLANQGVQQAVVKSQRPLLAQALLAGTNAKQAPQKVGMVFNLCAKAQASAAAFAVEQAMQTESFREACGVRAQLVRMELMREHLWRICLDWPVLRGLSANHALMKQVLGLDKDWETCLDANKQAFVCGEDVVKPSRSKASKVAMKLGTLLKEQVFYMPPKAFFECKGAEEFLLWAQYTQLNAPQLIQYLVTQAWQGSGSTDTQALPAFETVWLEQVLSSDYADGFMQAPSIDAKTYESTPYARQRSHPLIVELEQKFGVGLLTRFAAVLLELAKTYLDLEKALMQSESRCDAVGSAPDKTGFGAVEAARGRLLHRVVLDAENKVETYQIVAPTEWNFHPDGVLKRALETLQGDAKSIEQQAKLLIHAMDPCVAFELEVSHA
ncbi:nickel-dependent hydrogenase large subunit [Ghiorsea bivora]|uniref:nickel-dependent hydrogenase large subunit n=1 Tax=Ghiorsea bivora TaxID=1485545 RepID=UPI0005717D5E|nr:nickel-dependent hydrogenase large subunit [Ghiorsea bivora]